jgi:hypothetical protein
MKKNKKDRVDDMARRLYNECYVANIQWNHWLNIARFVIDRIDGAKKQKEGFAHSSYDNYYMGGG